MPSQLRRRRKMIDMGLAIGLGGILLIVYVGDLLFSRTTTNVVVHDNEPGAARPLRIAVTPPEFDDMGQLLTALGPGYKYTEILLSDLERPKRLSEFDIVFFTCGESKNIAPIIKDNLRRYVAGGGTLYASDLRFDVIAEAFPEFVDPVTNAQGVQQEVKADVTDPGLRQILGPVMPLHFDQAGWRPAAFKGQDVQVLLQGTIQTNAGIPITCPLLVQFPYEEGTVVFTSFHNEKQQKGLEEKLLQYLVLTTVTARTQSKVTKTMITGGFSPQSQNLLSASQGNPTVSRTHYNKDAERLQFVLGFENRGVELRLTVQGPDGKEVEKEGTSTFTIDIAKAAPGEWKCTITALRIPYSNFPFTLTVGGDSDKKGGGKIAGTQPTRQTGPVEFNELKPVVMEQKKLRLAVTPKGSDDIGLVLRSLGEGFQYADIPINSLTDAQKLADFDVVFVNCAGTPPLTDNTRDAIRRFVGKGGTMYASDLQYPTIAHAFPELVSNQHVDNADPQKVDGDVLDQGLRDAIGATMEINFNAGGWRTAAFGGKEVTVLIAGNYKRRNFGGTKHSPLLVRFPHQDGTVIFTSFHNSAQNTDTVVKVLKHLVFTAVTSQVQTTVNKTMEASGFFPKQEGLFSHSAGNPKITRSYKNKKVGSLQFALGLQAPGAKMKFTIVAPGGQKYEKEIGSTLTVEVPAAPVGEWLYTVEAIQVPYANFPFTVTVGEKEK